MTLVNSTTAEKSEYGFFSSVLRRHIGHGRRFMPQQVANLTGFALCTIKGWLRGTNDTSIRKLPALIEACGDGLFHDFAAELGFQAFRIGDAAVNANEHAAGMAGALRDLLRALEDRKIDHREAATLVPVFRRLASESASFAAALERKRVAA